MESAEARAKDQVEGDFLFDGIFVYLAARFHFLKKSVETVLLSLQLEQSAATHVEAQEVREIAKRCSQAVAFMMKQFKTNKAMDVFNIALSFVKLETRAPQFLAEKNAESLLMLVEQYFSNDGYVPSRVKMILGALKEFNLSNDIVRYIVIPEIIALQAMYLIEKHEEKLHSRFPELKSFFVNKVNLPAVYVLGRGSVMFKKPVSCEASKLCVTLSSVSSPPPNKQSDDVSRSPAFAPATGGAYLRFLKGEEFTLDVKPLTGEECVRSFKL